MNKIKGFIKKISVFLIVAMVCGIIVPSGAKAAVELDYDYIGDAFSEGLMIVGKDKKYGYIDEAGKEIVEPKYDDAWNFREGLAKVEKDGKLGFIDKAGNEIIEPKYDDVDEFKEGIARVKKDGKYSIIDKKGEIVFSLKYNNLSEED